MEEVENMTKTLESELRDNGLQSNMGSLAEIAMLIISISVALTGNPAFIHVPDTSLAFDRVTLSLFRLGDCRWFLFLIVCSEPFLSTVKLILVGVMSTRPKE